MSTGPDTYGRPGDPIGPDVLGSPEPPRRSRRRTAIIGAGVVTSLAVAGGAFAAYSFLGGGGAQPEDALPGGAVAYFEVDLDPGAGQKVNALRLAQKFPDSGVKGEGSLKDDLLRRAFEEEGSKIDYDRDVKPWLGDRIGFVALDELDEDGDPLVAAALQVKDRDDAQAGLDRLIEAERASAEDGRDPESEPLSGYAFGAEGYVILAETMEIAQRVVDDAEQGTLADDPTYSRALEELGGDRVATAWVDVGRAVELLPVEQRETLLVFEAPDAVVTGSYVLGLSVGSDAVELEGKAVDLDLGGLGYSEVIGSEPGQLLGQMPPDALSAGSATGLGQGLTDVFGQLEEAGLLDEDGLGFVREQAAGMGIELPADIMAVLGDETAYAVLPAEGEPLLAGRTRGGDPARAIEVINRVYEAGQDTADEPFTDTTYCGTLTPEERDLLGSCENRLAPVPGPEPAPPIDLTGLLREYDGGLVVSSDPEATTAMAGDGRLRDEERFRRAMPDAVAPFAVYVDLARIFETYPEEIGLTETAVANVQPLEAIGISATATSFQVRLTLR